MHKSLLLTWIVFIGITAGLVINNDLESAKSRFAQYNSQLISNISSRALIAETALETFASTLHSDQPLDYPSVERTAEKLLERYSFLYMLEVADKVRHEQRQQYEQQISKVYPDFRIRFFDYANDRQWKDTPKSPDYFPIIFQYPYFTDEANVIGLDLNSSDTLIEAMNYSQKLNAPLASRPILMVENKLGYIIHRRIEPDTNQPGIEATRYALLVVKAKEIFAMPAYIPAHFSFTLKHGLFDRTDSDDNILLGANLEPDQTFLSSIFPQLEYWKNLSKLIPSQPFILETRWQLSPSDFSIKTLSALFLLMLAMPLFIQRYAKRYFNNKLKLMAADGNLYKMANFDALTGLANRNHLLEYLNKSIQKADRLDATFCLLFMDLNDFKKINDSYGHSAGDFALKTFSETLKPNIREDELVGRYGGDEFVLITDNHMNPVDTNHLKQRISVLFQQPFQWKQHEITISPALGFAIYPDDGTSSQELLDAADKRMYEDKMKRKAAQQANNPR